MRRPAGGFPRVIVIAGEPGSGKSSLGRALAGTVGFVLLDLDDLAPVEALAGLMGRRADEIDDPAVASRLRGPRYEALLATAATNIGLGHGVVLVGPFSAERRDAARWQALGDRLGVGDVRLVYLDCPPAERRRRLVRRASDRDARKLVAADLPGERPTVAHVRVDARREVADELEELLAELGGHGRALGSVRQPVGERTC